MLVTASAGTDNVFLAIHIIAVIVAFAVAVGYPLVVRSVDAVRKRPPVVVHKFRVLLSRVAVTPALIVALAAGIYLSADEHQFKQFYVQWGIAAIVVIFGLEGALISRGHKNLAVLAEAEHAGDGAALVQYKKAGRRTDLAEAAVVVIILLTAIFMFAKP